MIDIRPVGYVIGWLVVALGASMALPMTADFVAGERNARVFGLTAVVTLLVGVLMALACASEERRGLNVQQSFLLTSGTWVVFPLFGALPFWIGAPQASFTDAFFEAMSAVTTTGSTVFVRLDELPPGTLLWRGMLQWMGGLGIVVVAIVFLPTLKVGGMQFFRSEAFDTLGKILPRAGQIALSLTSIYCTLTFLCFMCYMLSGMVAFDAAVHSLTTVATGGMANSDASFIPYGPAAQYSAVAFMILAAMPFVRYVQFARGTARPLLRDPQIRGFLLTLAGFSAAIAAWLALVDEMPLERAFRDALFNVVSVATGTGFASADYNAWGPLAMTMIFIIGLIGGCTGSTACSVKIFRYQLLFSAIAAEVRRLHSPNRVVMPRYDGRAVTAEVMDSVMAFFMLFYLTLAVAAVALVLLGLAPITAISGAATALANIGPGLGPEIGPVGNFAGLPDAAKWLLAFVMLVGRLEVMSVYVLFTLAFWRT